MLTSIDFPNSVTSIGKKAFWGCSSLTEIHFRSQTPNSIVFIDSNGTIAFPEEMYSSCTLYIPSGTRWAYRHHPIFGQFKNIVTE